MKRTLTSLALVALLLGGCASDTVVDLSVTHTVEIDFHAMEGNVTLMTERDAIVFDLTEEPDYVDFESRLRCVGLDPFESTLHVRRLESEGLEAYLDFRVEIAPYPGGDWTPLADFAALVTDQSSRGFDDDGFQIYLEGLDVLEAVALTDSPQYELRASSKVANAVMDLELGVDLVVVFSSEAGACPGP